MICLKLFLMPLFKHKYIKIRAWHLKPDIEMPSSNRCYSRKTISIIYSKCVSLALVIQHAMLMRHTVICDLPGSANFFPLYLINGTIFGKKLSNIKCVFWFPLQILSETFLIPRKIERDTIKTAYWYSHKVPLIPVRYECNFNFLYRISKNSPISNLMKVGPLGVELIHADRGADRQTDRHNEFYRSHPVV